MTTDERRAKLALRDALLAKYADSPAVQAAMLVGWECDDDPDGLTVKQRKERAAREQAGANGR